MQRLRKIKETETLANSLDPINKNFESVQSQHSGTSFPQDNLVLGQPCFRTDTMSLYILSNVEYNLWIRVADLTLTLVNKEYVDTLRIPLSRVDDIIDTATNKIKMSLMYTGTQNGQLVMVGDNDKIATSLIDTGVKAGQVVMVNSDGKIPNGILNIGYGREEIPILNDKALIPDTILPSNLARFNESGQIVFPNGTKMWVK